VLFDGSLSIVVPICMCVIHIYGCICRWYVYVDGICAEKQNTLGVLIGIVAWYCVERVN
jgi:hypothetical protein